jgi:hypothetical protein
MPLRMGETEEKKKGVGRTETQKGNIYSKKK